MTMTFNPSNIHSEALALDPAETAPPLSLNVLMAFATALLIIIGFVGLGGDAAANSPAKPVSADSEMVDAIEVYVVKRGDTLWAIASEVARPGEDIRPIVDHLKEISGGPALEIGQRIVIDHAMIRS